MGYAAIPPPAQVLILPENLAATPSTVSYVAEGPVADILILSAAGATPLRIDTVVQESVLILTEAGAVATATVPLMWVPGSSPGPEPLRLFYTSAVLKEARLDVTLSDALTFSTRAGGTDITAAYGVPSFSFGTLHTTFAYDQFVPSEYLHEVSLGYATASITVRNAPNEDLALSYSIARPSTWDSPTFLPLTYFAGPLTEGILPFAIGAAYRVPAPLVFKNRPLTAGGAIKQPFSVIGGSEVRYSLQASLSAGVTIPVTMREPVLSGVMLSSGISSVLAGSDMSIPLRQSILHEALVPIGFPSRVLSPGISVEYGFRQTIRNGYITEMPTSYDIRAGVAMPLYIRDTVVGGVEAVYSLLLRTPVYRSWAGSSPLTDSGPLLRHDLFVLDDPSGTERDGIELMAGEITAEEGNFGWTGTFELAHPEDLSRFRTHDLFTISVGSDAYILMVETKTLNREGPAKYSATLRGISPAIQLTSPRARTFTKTWATPMMSHDIIKEAAGSYPIQIDILNWAIPANRYGVSNTAPMDVIKQVAEAVGGVVDSLPDGTLRVRYKNPTPVPLWGPATLDHPFYDDTDVYSVVDEYAPFRVYDKFRVMDVEDSAGADTLEFVPEETDTTRGVIRAYPSPWREDGTLTSTAWFVVIGGYTQESRIEEEVIEIYGGEGTTKYPVMSVISIQWQDASLLGVIAGNDSKKVKSTHPTEKFSMLKIRYNTRCFVTPVIGVAGREAQFLLRRD